MFVECVLIRTPVAQSNYNAGTNRLATTSFGYDSAGNETTIAPYTVSYDGEERQTGIASAENGSAGYGYDGEGRRVSKTVGGIVTTYVYDAAGALAAEYGGAQPVCGTCYLTRDGVGSVRVVTDESGAVVGRHDFLPFGEELATANRTGAEGYGLADGVTQRFTGKERDVETGWDYFGARYFSGAVGRFGGADAPFNDQETGDGQSWNLYSYGRNNPLTEVDPTGANACDSGDPTCNYSVTVTAQGTPVATSSSPLALLLSVLTYSTQAVQQMLQIFQPMGGWR